MTYRSRLLGAAGVCALAVLGANPAHAAGTIAGTTITNTVTVNFQVNSIAQTSTSAADTLTVDRTINLTVAEIGTTTTVVTPGSVSRVTAFTVTNTSNAALDFALAVTQAAGGTAIHGGTDTFDATNIRFFRDNPTTGTVGSYDAADTATFLDEIPADGSATVFVLADIPLGLANNAVAGVTLTATGREAGTAGTQGAALVQTTGANTSGMDTVFADLAGSGDAARDASFGGRDDYTVSAATLSAVKSSRVVSDPVNGTTSPKMIPGAVIEYCIAISNASGSADASTVTVTDPIPTNLTYLSSFGVKTNGTATIVSGVATCATDTTGTGTMASNTVSGTLPLIQGGQTRTVVFQATIN